MDTQKNTFGYIRKALNHGLLGVEYCGLLVIAMVALARYIILDIKDMSETRILSVSVAILLLTLAVLAIRFGHVRFPYREDENAKHRPFVRE